MSDGFTETPHRSRKNKRKWCKGKPGVEHVPELVESKAYVVLSRPLPRPCHWSVYGYGGDRTRAHSSWWCDHEWRCKTCGRYMRHATQAECPSYHPPHDGHPGTWPCAECGHQFREHGSSWRHRPASCPDGCTCGRFWLYPKGETER